MPHPEYKRLLFHLLVTRRILAGKTWPSLGRKHDYAHFMKHILENGLGKSHTRGWSHYLNSFEHCRKSTNRKQGTDIWTYNIAIKIWNNCLQTIYTLRVLKLKFLEWCVVQYYKQDEEKGIEVWQIDRKCSEVKWSEVMISVVMWDEMEW